jgi:hypothetical protein
VLMPASSGRSCLGRGICAMLGAPEKIGSVKIMVAAVNNPLNKGQ